MTATLPYPTAAPARESGQKDAKDASGRQDASYARYTAGGLPVLVLDRGGPTWLVTVSNYRGRRMLWWVGPTRPILDYCRALGLTSVALDSHRVIDELLTDEGEPPCC